MLMSLFNYFQQFRFNTLKAFACMGCLILPATILAYSQNFVTVSDNIQRQRISINENWRFYKYNPADEADKLIYNVRPVVGFNRDDKPADSKPTEAENIEAKEMVLKPWILPTGNDFIKDPSKRYVRPTLMITPGS